jgi:aryl-alcohol dehydrogenase-like predicted oxidoreductase
MIDRNIEGKVLDYCKENEIGVIVYRPMQKGLLTAKLTRERIQNLPESDDRRTYPYFQEPDLTASLELAEGLYPIAKRSGRTVAQLAIAWTLRQPQVTAAIVGARRPSQAEEVALAGEWVLSQEDISAIDRLLEKRQKTLNLT